MRRIVDCGKVIGLLVDNCPGVRADMMQFAVRRDKQNREEFELAKSKKKGGRELNNLACSINYDRGIVEQSRRQSSAKDARISLGKEDRCK